METTNSFRRAGIVRAAVVQAAPVLFDTAKSLQKLVELTANAVKQGAELVVFPEAFIGGYPKGNDFGVTVAFEPLMVVKNFVAFSRVPSKYQVQPLI